jgi:hypothetical protein
MTATVDFAASGGERIVVPLAALIQQGEQAAVWIVGADGTLSRRAVAIERYTDAGALLKDGLAAGETIVAAGAFKLAEGERVRIAAEAGQ